MLLYCFRIATLRQLTSSFIFSSGLVVSHDSLDCDVKEPSWELLAQDLMIGGLEKSGATEG